VSLLSTISHTHKTRSITKSKALWQMHLADDPADWDEMELEEAEQMEAEQEVPPPPGAPRDIDIEEMIDNIVGAGTRNGYVGDNLELVAYCRTHHENWLTDDFIVEFGSSGY
jgi:hypothetical protein